MMERKEIEPNKIQTTRLVSAGLAEHRVTLTFLIEKRSQ